MTNKIPRVPREFTPVEITSNGVAKNATSYVSVKQKLMSGIFVHKL